MKIFFREPSILDCNNEFAHLDFVSSFFRLFKSKNSLHLALVLVRNFFLFPVLDLGTLQIPFTILSLVPSSMIIFLASDDFRSISYCVSSFLANVINSSPFHNFLSLRTMLSGCPMVPFVLPFPSLTTLVRLFFVFDVHCTYILPL